MTPVFTTDRLIARPWDPETDATDAFALYGDPEVVRYLGASPEVVPCLDDQKARLQRIRAVYDAKTDHTGFWALERKEDGQVVGAILFKQLPDAQGEPTGDYEIGWHLAKAYWGQGYATEAAQAVVQYAFQNRPDLQTLHAVAYPQNLKSLAVMQRLGMISQGQTDRYYGITCAHFTLDRP